jgi:multidrug efflux pump subunit AcrB
MWIVQLALRRPYTIVVAALVLLLLTPFVLLRTSTDIIPEINIPVVRAVWLYNGLSAKEIEQRIVYSHERIISAQVAEFEHIESTSYSGAGVIKVFLQPEASISDGVAQITGNGQAVLRFLPPGTTPPIIIRYNASTVPILQVSLASSRFSEQEFQDLAFNQVRVGLMTVRGASGSLQHPDRRKGAGQESADRVRSGRETAPCSRRGGPACAAARRSAGDSLRH